MKSTKAVVIANLQRLIASGKITKSELAEIVGVSKSAATYWAKGANAPDIDQLDLICDAYGVDFNFMFSDTEKAPAPEERELAEKELDQWLLALPVGAKRAVVAFADALQLPEIVLSDTESRAVADQLLADAPGIGNVIQGITNVKHFGDVWRTLRMEITAAAPGVELKPDGLTILTPHYYRHNYASILYRQDAQSKYAAKLNAAWQ